MSATFRDNLKATLSLAGPVVLVQIGLMTMGIVDTMTVGRMGDGEVVSQAMAAVALGHATSMFFLLFGLGVLSGLDPLISQAFGAEDKQAIADHLRSGVLLSLLLAIPISLVLLRTDGLFRLLDQREEIIPGASDYCFYVIIGNVPFLVFVALRQALQSLTVMRPIVIAVFAANLFNVVANYALVFGNFGFPALGVKGSAMATGISRVFLAGLFACLCWKTLKPYMQFRTKANTWPELMALLRLGIPIGIQTTVEVGIFTAVAIGMGRISEVALSAHSITMSLAALVFMVPLGFGLAAATRVGHAVGKRDLAAVKSATYFHMSLGVAFMVISGAIFLIFPRALATFYTAEESVIAAAATLIPIAGMFAVFDGVQVVALGVLRGMADTKMTAFVAIAGFWGMGFPLGVWLAFYTDIGYPGLWWGLTAGLGATAIMFSMRVIMRFKAGVESMATPRRKSQA